MQINKPAMSKRRPARKDASSWTVSRPIAIAVPTTPADRVELEAAAAAKIPDPNAENHNARWELAAYPFTAPNLDPKAYADWTTFRSNQKQNPPLLSSKTTKYSAVLDQYFQSQSCWNQSSRKLVLTDVLRSMNYGPLYPEGFPIQYEPDGILQSYVCEELGTMLLGSPEPNSIELHRQMYPPEPRTAVFERVDMAMAFEPEIAAARARGGPMPIWAEQLSPVAKSTKKSIPVFEIEDLPDTQECSEPSYSLEVPESPLLTFSKLTVLEKPESTSLLSDAIRNGGLESGSESSSYSDNYSQWYSDDDSDNDGNSSYGSELEESARNSHHLRPVESSHDSELSSYYSELDMPARNSNKPQPDKDSDDAPTMVKSGLSPIASYDAISHDDEVTESNPRQQQVLQQPDTPYLMPSPSPPGSVNNFLLSTPVTRPEPSTQETKVATNEPLSAQNSDIPLFFPERRNIIWQQLFAPGSDITDMDNHEYTPRRRVRTRRQTREGVDLFWDAPYGAWESSHHHHHGGGGSVYRRELRRRSWWRRLFCFG